MAFLSNVFRHSLVILCLMVGLMASAATVRAAPPGGDDMQFFVVRSNQPGCEPTCPEWISAEGAIVGGTPARLKKLLKSIGDRRLPIVVTSPGGNVDAAMVLGRRSDVLAGNRMAFLLFTDFPALPAAERNLTRWLILDPGARELFRDWKTVAAEAAGALRVDVGRHPNDAQANQLVGELAVHSEHFRQWWAGHRVATRSAGSVRLHHPAVGDLELNFENLAFPDDPDQTLRV
ncbi:MAG: hypothetical protein ACK4M8_15650, partial [Allorhizobium sp.]